MSDDTLRARPLAIAPALLAALIVLSTDAASARPVAPVTRDVLSSRHLTVIGHRLGAVRVIRSAASYPVTGEVRGERAVDTARGPTVRLLRESLLALPPPLR